MILKPQGQACSIPRRHQAIEALLLLAWRKAKAERPQWLVKELKTYR